MASASTVTRFPSPPPSSEKLVDDNHFRALLPPEEWGRLPVATWRRFSKRLGPGRTIVYAGEIEEAAFSRIGWWLARRDDRAIERRRREAETCTRADRQHAPVLAGDERGIYREYPPAV